MDNRVTGHEHTMSSYPVVGTPLGRTDRPHATAPSDPKGHSRMRGTAADRSVHHSRVQLSGGTGDRNAATKPNGYKA